MLNPSPNKDNTYRTDLEEENDKRVNPERGGILFHHVRDVRAAAEQAERPFLVWNGRVYVTSKFLIDTGIRATELE